MFFLKELPSRQMVERYVETYGSDPALISDALLMMRRASLLIRKLETYFAGHGLSQLRFLVLIVIDREPDRQWLSPNEIAQRIDVSKPVMTRTLHALQADGLVGITASETDGRSKEVTLTPEGHARLQATLPEYYEILSREMAQSAAQ
ncbi:putative HTH-type transcriptional regulator, MarR family [Phaeobacter piscinae]|uniref:HTH-type transcriptional regulator, MarR family n=1 Tax=Phaeobacter piscinae TaxID=1580596 RepID=A0ABN5DCH8_9RHOB|nr:MarR family transcriptional regulator [Phaeobacter piscinae]ATG35029.1 putative HTH-type transcriptional regulator, MarR family [Phaeobacter piscinae]AUQ85549.1 putative HTH-type transcriptional regulator, MarR family [Phaeobacter piscinae]AUR23433.1 putative HTH-type transcriptional regulator, MarR family [Phaeobacter piscinae]